MTVAARPRAIALLLALLAIGAGSRRAEACSCMTSGPPCEAVWQANAVFVARVISIEPVPAARGVFLRSRRVHLDVLEAFRGMTTSQVDVMTGSGGGDCGYPFNEGATYLVYASSANDAPELLTTSICQRTRTLASAADDLAYARGISSSPAAGGVISGTVRNRDRLVDANGRRSYAPIDRIDVAFECSGLIYHATTNKAGRYDISGLPTGTCAPRLRPVVGRYWMPHQPEVQVRDLRGCASVDFVLAYDGHIRGRIVDGRGTPIAGMTVDALTPGEHGRWSPAARYEAVTDAEGVYEIVKVPPGEYVVGANLRTDFKGQPHGEPVFAPGVTRAVDAATVRLEPSQYAELGDLTLPSGAKFVAIRGSVVTSDGQPIAGARIYLFGESSRTRIFSAPLFTDERGAFVIAVPEGVPATLVAERKAPEPDNPWKIATSEPSTFMPREGHPPQRLVIR